VQTPNALSALVSCRQNCASQAPESSLGGVCVADRVRETVPGGRTSNGKKPAHYEGILMIHYINRHT